MTAYRPQSSRVNGLRAILTGPRRDLERGRIRQPDGPGLPLQSLQPRLGMRYRVRPEAAEPLGYLPPPRAMPNGAPEIVSGRGWPSPQDGGQFFTHQPRRRKAALHRRGLRAAPIRAAAALVGVVAFDTERGGALTAASAGRLAGFGASSGRSMARR
jgi:hypothetical protein